MRPESEFTLRAAYIEAPARLPVGLGGVPAIRPVNEVSRAILSAKSRIDISSPLPRFTGSAPSYRSAAATMASAASSTYRNSRVGEPSPHK